MTKILGLDLGTNSIGWALRDTDEAGNQFVDKGVIHFETGVAYTKVGEQPKVKIRTEARSKRRNYQAEKYRKWELLQCLINHKMCPLTIDELNSWKKFKRGVGRKYPSSKLFLDWLRFDFDGDGVPDFERMGLSKHDNCYVFRWLAVSEDQGHRKIFQENPLLLGRVLYQMVQRRGFNTLDKDDPENRLIEEGRKNNETNEIEVVGVSVLDKLIKEKYNSLGAALFWGQKNGELEDLNNNRIRNRFTYRSYFANELELIFTNLGYDLNSDFYKQVFKAIVWQRPLRSQKGLVGYCTFDRPIKNGHGNYIKSGKLRTPISHPLYEEFRTWCEINNLKLELPIGVDREKFLSENVFPLFNRATNFSLADRKSNSKNEKGGSYEHGLKHKLNLIGVKVLGKYDAETLDGMDGKTFQANTFLNWLSGVFGPDWSTILKWEETLRGSEKSGSYLRVEDVWHLCYDAIETKKQKDEFSFKIIQILQKHFPHLVFDPKKVSSIKLSKGYSALSASTMRKILPFLKKGLIYSHAVFIANIEKVIDIELSDLDKKEMIEDFDGLLKENSMKRDVYGVVNSLVSERINRMDYFNLGDDYVLDELDKRDILLRIIDRIGQKRWSDKNVLERDSLVSRVSQHYLNFLKSGPNSNPHKGFLRNPRFEDVLSEYLISKYGCDRAKIEKYLWHPSEQEKYSPAITKKRNDGSIILDEINEPMLFLGDPNPISRGFKNPMAMRTLHELKKHLNFLLEKKKINSNTKLIVEIARELNDGNRRKAYQRYQNENKNRREGFRKKLEEHTSGFITSDLLDRYQLFEEQNKICLYCGQTIQILEVLNGTCEIEHTIPAGLSNCDELFNLTLAHPHCNKEKSNRIPFEWKERFESIKQNIKYIYANYKKYHKNYESAFDRTRLAKDKESKDREIQNRHYQKMHLDYWQKKYETFVIEEVRSNFRRQQLTDTQVITKYALPYLRTVFKRVEVQKGTVTDKFRKIYKIGPRIKDRSQHWHHTMDAAVLTLIPPAGTRDFLMNEYNAAIDNNSVNSYLHPKPLGWPDFHHAVIAEFEKDILVVNISQDRILKETIKKRRVRGKILKNAQGKPILMRGDSIRGQLHQESVFGMIKMPITALRDGKHRLVNIKGELQFQKNESRNDDLFVVKKLKITDLKNLEEIDMIVVDPNLRLYLIEEIKNRMKSGNSFDEALKNLYAFGRTLDKNGNVLNPIRHIRCRVKTGANSFVQNPQEIRRLNPVFESKYPHKRHAYASNAELPVCAIYEWIEGKKTVREVKPISLFDIAKVSRANEGQLAQISVILTKGKGKKIQEYNKELLCLLRPNQAVLFYKTSINELVELYDTERRLLSNRLYYVLKFEDGKVFFNHHLTSMSDGQIIEEMKRLGFPAKGDSKINFDKPTLRLRLSQASLNMAIQGLHFNLHSDGTIQWLF